MEQDQLNQLDYYTLLGVAEDASLGTIRAAFRTFARKYHPDRFAGATEEKRERATQIYRRGSEGMQVLTDPLARELYDRARKQGIVRLTANQREGAARLLRPSTQPPARIRSSRAKAFYLSGRKALEEGDLMRAFRAFKEANQIEPDSRVIERRLRKVERMLRGTE